MTDFDPPCSFNSLAAGKGTMYIEACPQMSYFLAAGEPSPKAPTV